MADDRGQDVVEVVGDAAGELADDLHLGRLRDLTLELRFLAIVLEQEQHGCVAEPAQAGDRQRHRLRRLPREANREIAGHCRTTRVAAHGVSDRRPCPPSRRDRRDRLGIDRAGDAAGPAECFVHGQEAPVTIDERKADREDVEQRLEIGSLRCGRRFALFE